MAVRNDNPMPYAPGNLAEARLLLETLCQDWTDGRTDEEDSELAISR